MKRDTDTDKKLLIHNGYAYGLDKGILACVEVQTGEPKVIAEEAAA